MVILSTWAVAIISDRRIKDFSELYCPFFVQFVREYYGFEDENLIEEQCNKLTREYQSHCKLIDLSL